MGKILIWIGLTLLFTIIGLVIWWVGSKIYLSIRRDEAQFEMEKEGYELATKSIKKEKEKHEP